MEYGYIIKLSSKKVYKEIQLPVDSEVLSLGMDLACDVRLYKEDFFESFQLSFSKNNNTWEVICSENIYIDDGDVRKLVSKELKHGDSFLVRYQPSGQEVFKIEFLYDFDNDKKNYDRIIDISAIPLVTIGSASGNNIVINSNYVKNDSIALKSTNNGLVLQINHANYGVYHNGRKASPNEIINNGDFISIANFSFYYKDGKLFTEATNNVNTNITYVDNQQASEYPKFNRNTRVKHIVDSEPIQILDPPSAPKKPKGSLLTKLLPSAVMIIMGIAMISVSPFMLLSSAMGVVTAIISLISDKKEFKKGTEERIEKYNKYIENKTEEIEEYREDERSLLNDIYINQDKEINNFNVFSSDLFDRRTSDSDFLQVNLGSGTLPAIKSISYKKQEKLEVEDELQEIPQNLSNKYRTIDGVPIVCDFKEINAIGIYGDKNNRIGLFKNIVIDIVARQFCNDVELFFISSTADENELSILHLLRMLPQVTNKNTGYRNIVTDNESKTFIFEYLYKELTTRVETKSFNKHIIVFILDDNSFKSHPISKFIDTAKDIGVTFVFLSDIKENITTGCDYLIEITTNNEATLIATTNSEVSQQFSFNAVSNKNFSNIINLMAPVFAEEISLEGTLTKNISLFKLLNILSVDDIDLENNWNKSQVFKSMAAPLGVSKSGVVNLDLHDKAHGPHGLVAGTTGSGKSEILQTYILSMATLFHPYEVGFVIIDFKGGGMVNQFKNLPHLIGAITNIDGKEIDRSLKSIKAELQKRQRLFAEAEVNHIDKYIKKFRKGEVTIPIPHLILIVDEFAELKAEQPEFMKELISAARIGRSLGVHLILATQKPSGQVNEQIWSNSRFKLCLKVQDQSDSNEVIKSPLAAEIKEPGRAYLQVGNNEIFELFQSAYSGASERNDIMSVKEFEINSLNEYGKRSQIFAQKKKKSEDDNRTQLDAIVSYVNDFCLSNSIQKLPDICLPPLPDEIGFTNNENKSDQISIGFYDDPDTQYQGDMYKNINENNMLIIGSSQTGKTNLLQLLIRSIASEKSPKEASFYILDFGSMILKNFETLKHVGGVVTSTEEEKLKNLIKLLSLEINERKERLLSVGVSSFSAFIDAGFTDYPHIYILIDNYPVFKELYSEKYEDDLLFLIREGLTYGLTFVMTSPSTSGLGYKYLSNFSEHIALSCNDAGEYSNLFDRCRIEPKNIPGRAITAYNKVIYELQTYLAFDGKKEIDRVNSIRDFVENCNQKHEVSAKKIPEVPSLLSADYIEQNYNINVTTQLATALSYQSVEPIIIELTSMPLLSVVGKRTESMNLFVNSVLNNIKNYYFDRPSEVYIIDSFKREFKTFENEAYVNQYTVDYSNIDGIFESMSTQLEERYNDVIDNGIENLNNAPYLLLIINSADAIEYISKSKPLMEMYNTFMTKYKSMKFTILFTGIEDSNIGYSAPELYKKIKESKTAFIFSSLQEHKIFDIPIPFMRQNKKPLEITEGFFIRENDIDKIRFVEEV